MKITDTIKYVGANDETIDLFEGQYHVPHGVSYNSYVILDEKIAIMDTVDQRATEEWLNNLEKVLDGRTPDYLIVSHMEPDHAANIQRIAEKYPEMKIVGNAKTFPMIAQFFTLNVEGREVIVKEGDTLSLGAHTLQFFMAPMVHWPEVMVTYEQSEKVLFSADGFGKFGSLSVEEPWEDEARRYFINIVGKYGAPVQTLLKKAATLDIAMICPLHGPVLTENLGHYIGLYDTWSSYRPEEKGILIAYASIYGNTHKAAEALADELTRAGQQVCVMDLCRCDLAEAVSNAFRYDRLVLVCATYDGGMYLPMEDYLHHLKAKNFQKRKVGLVENGSWAPMAAKKMKEVLEGMKEMTFCDTVVTIRSAMKENDLPQIQKLAEELCAE
ncbi:MAG: FprA family A-type flavoprotein [Lachnospiraceae bacterium]|nr:FprA family A-type flavoprotein [Lachnospiraceae bacterium]